MIVANLDDIEVPEGVDVAKAQRLIQWIYRLEAENDKTNRFNSNEMIHKILTRIQSDVKCI